MIDSGYSQTNYHSRSRPCPKAVGYGREKTTGDQRRQTREERQSTTDSVNIEHRSKGTKIDLTTTNGGFTKDITRNNLMRLVSSFKFRPDNVRSNAFLGEKEVGEKNSLGTGVRSSLINKKLQKNFKIRARIKTVITCRSKYQKDKLL